MKNIFKTIYCVSIILPQLSEGKRVGLFIGLHNDLHEVGESEAQFATLCAGGQYQYINIAKRKEGPPNNRKKP